MKLLFASFALLASAFGQQPRYPFLNTNLPVEQRNDNLLSLMTVEEKINCLGTRTGVPRLGVPNIGSSEGIHGLVQRGGGVFSVEATSG
jgi:beta-glucosidase